LHVFTVFMEQDIVENTLTLQTVDSEFSYINCVKCF
ncbi:hypothetical protein D027_2814B, partial [Vibrio parahaemolyticus 861]